MRKKDRGIKRDLARETRLAHLVVTHYSRISSACFCAKCLFLVVILDCTTTLYKGAYKIKYGEFLFREGERREIFYLKKRLQVGASFCVLETLNSSSCFFSTTTSFPLKKGDGEREERRDKKRARSGFKT